MFELLLATIKYFVFFPFTRIPVLLSPIILLAKSLDKYF